MVTVAQSAAVDSYISANLNTFTAALRGKKAGETVAFKVQANGLFLQVLATLLSWRFAFTTTLAVSDGVLVTMTR